MARVAAGSDLFFQTTPRNLKFSGHMEFLARFLKMISDFRSYDSFPVKTRSWSQIFNIAKSRHSQLQKEALDVNYSK